MASCIFVDEMVDYSSYSGCVRISYMGNSYMVCERMQNSKIDDYDFFRTSFDCFFNYDKTIRDYFFVLEVNSYGKCYRFSKINHDLNAVYLGICSAKPFGEVIRSLDEIISPYLV